MSPLRTALKRILDRLGLTARVYDLRAQILHVLDRRTARRNADFLRDRAPDGLPLPPPKLVYAVAGHFDLREYYESGVFHAQLLRRLLTANRLDVDALGTILDFGCGCGRVTRQWAGLADTTVHGCDYNRRLVDWCRASLPFACFETTGLEPPLPYEDGCFEFVYAISVFTHLTESLQHAWMQELSRILAPDGVLAFTTKGRSRLSPLDASELNRFERGELVVQAASYAGRNLCAAYHPESFVRERLARGLEVIDFLPAEQGGEQSQDVYLVRKPVGRTQAGTAFAVR